ncbi:MAG: flagellar hook-associated protein FlgK [Proteobacteria bacterium]|nr:flagellar hook-associated protein FlgK [Pseudomonadota bacterium]
MSDLLSIGSGAVKNSQLALTVVSNNIANVNTEGYVKQSLIYAENTPASLGRFSIGSGAVADGIRRAYDGLIENTVRSSESDLAAQQPIVDMTNRLVDVFGDQQASLVPALGGLFDSFRDLSLEASSEVRRDQVLGNAESLAGRFNDLSAQLDAFDVESEEALEAKVGELNVMLERLGQINGKLQKIKDLSKQPADLLDLRDQVLRDISGLVKIAVVENTNGTVKVGISNLDKTVVENNRFGQVNLQSTGGRPASMQLVLSFDETKRDLGQLEGGELSGLMSFRDRVLSPTMAGFESLATNLVTEINAAHAQGMDLSGDVGQDLFAVRPEADVFYADSAARLQVDVAAGSDLSLDGKTIQLQYDGDRDQWFGLNSDGQRVFAQGSNTQLTIDGVDVEITGSARDGDQIQIGLRANVARSMHVAISDVKKLAAAQLFNVIPAATNVGDAQAQVSLSAVPTAALPALSSVLANNAHPTAATTVQTTFTQALMQVPAGTSELQLLLASPATNAAELQVFTKDGRHLFGQALTDAQQQLAVSTANGFVANATYSNRYLNDGVTEVRIAAEDLSTTNGSLSINGVVISAANPVPSAVDLAALVNAQTALTGVQALIDEDDGTFVLTNVAGKESNPIELGALAGILSNVSGSITPDRYLDQPWQAGQVATSHFEVLADGTSRLRSEARIDGDAMPNVVAGADPIIAAGALNLNGKALSELALPIGQQLTSEDVETWLQENIDAEQLPLNVSLINEISVSADQLSKANGNLTINGVLVNGPEPIESLDDLAQLVNAAIAETGVEAYQAFDGSLTLRNAAGDQQGAPIIFGAGDGAIASLSGQVNPRLVIEAQRTAEDLEIKEVALTLGANGSFKDLAKLGMPGAIVIDEALSEDLIVFSTGALDTTAQIAASFVSVESDPLSLRQRTLDIEFTDANNYEITDRASGTVLAQRAYVPGSPISYQGVQVELSGTPVAGDRFEINNNAGGVSSSDNLSRLADIETMAFGSEQQTIQQGYLTLLNRAGTLSGQAQVAQQALEIVRDQAVATRESVAGVNLDEEAASLIKFQQSYQASARLIQTANQLFDVIVRL